MKRRTGSTIAGTWRGRITDGKRRDLLPRARSTSRWRYPGEFTISFPSRTFLLAVCFALLRSAVSASAMLPKNVVVVTINTLHADHLARYGYDQINSPAIDQLARTGTPFANVLTPMPSTLPAHTALMTGQYSVESTAHQHPFFLPA